MTVGELVENLNKFPKDYNIGLTMEYQDWDNGGWRTMWTDDIASFDLDEQLKSVTIITYS